MLSERSVDAIYRRLQRTPDDVDECLVLSTCARVEIIALGGDRGRLNAALSRALRDSLPAFIDEAPALSVREGERGARWLYRVAAGLESPILGEHEILGQLRDALADGIARQAVGPVLRRLVESALSAGGSARHETGIARGSLSLARIAALALDAPMPDAARPYAPSPTRTGRVLVVGAGRLGRQVATQLRVLGWRDLCIASRTYARAAALARDVDGAFVELESLGSEVPRAEAIITAVSGDAPILDAALLAESVRAGGRLRTVVDLGSPPNVATDGQPRDAVRWVGLRDLVARADEARTARASAVPDVELLIDRELGRWTTWWHKRTTAPLMTLRGTD